MVQVAAAGAVCWIVGQLREKRQVHKDPRP
jgi:hypothetical protein